MFKKLILSFVFGLSFLFTASAFELRDYAEYTGTTAENYTFSWNTVENAHHYNVRIRNEDLGYIIPLDDVVGVTQVVVMLPKTGHYVFMVRACNEDESICTSWSESTDGVVAEVAGQPRAWIVYGHVAGVGPIIIN